MPPTTAMGYLVALILLAALLALDLFILRMWRGRLRRSGANPEAQPQAVIVLGHYSPVLTWLRTGKEFWATHGWTTGGALLGSGLLLNFFNLVADRWLLSPGLNAIRLGLAWTGGGVAVIGCLTLARSLPGWRGLQRVSAWLQVRPFQLACLFASLLFALTAGMLAAPHSHRLVSPPVAMSAWLLAILLAVVGGWSRHTPQSGLSQGKWLWAAALGAFALMLRAIDTANIPVSLTGDEGSVGLVALDILSGKLANPLSSSWHGFPSLYFFIQAASIKLGGVGEPALRLTSALAGAMTVAAIYLVGRVFFGQRAGVIAGLLLAASHYHIHFSRIGLNNVWDGLGYTLALGLLWAGWRTGRRSYYLGAGLALGLCQFFYATSRALFVVIFVWLAWEWLRQREAVKSRLPHLALMALAAGVTLLPLAWYFTMHLDEFWGPLRAQSVFGNWLVNESGLRNEAPVLILLRQLGLGLAYFLYLPSQAWYRSGTAMLRPAQAVFFGIGILALLWRMRESRLRILLAWVLGVGLIGSLSVNTPAAQRYVAAAPAAALLVAWGLTWLAGAIARVWPRCRRQLALLATLAALVLAGDDLRFYFLEYLPNSGYRGPYDFEGYGQAIADRLADTLRALPGDGWEAQFFGPPRLSYNTIPSLPFLAHQVMGVDASGAWGAPQNPEPSQPNLAFVFLEGRQADLEAARQAYPGGVWRREVDAAGDLLYDLYLTPAPVSFPTPPLAPNVGVWQPALLWPLAFLILAVVGLWWLSRRAINFPFLEEDAAVVGEQVYALLPDLQNGWERVKGLKNRLVLAAQRSDETETAPDQVKPDGKVTGELNTQLVDLDGVARVHLTVELPVESSVHVTITHTRGAGVHVEQRPAQRMRLGWRRAGRLVAKGIDAARAAGVANLRTLEAGLFVLAVLVYLATRLVGLQDYPIYFFTDEAIQTVSAADLIQAGFRDPDKILLPTYFKNGSFYNLSLSVYWQVLPTLLFGKSLLITRLVSVLATLLAALAMGLALDQFFGVRRAWLGAMLLSIAPAWFLHSRTAFETVLFTSLYAVFLYLYLVYRYRDKRALYPALVCAALCFYAYSPGQVVIGVTGLMLLAADIRYHWQNRGLWWKAGLLGLLLAAPYLRFLDYRSSAPIDHLRILDSYWVEPLPLAEKLQRFFSTYLYGLNPAYWFIPNEHDLQRHLMKDYAHLPIYSLPFFTLGVALLLKNWRSSAHRLVLLAMLAAPTGSALVGIGITRVLVFTVPASLTSALGLAAVLDWWERWRIRSTSQERGAVEGVGEQEAVTGAAVTGRLSAHRARVSISVFLLLVGVNLFMLWHALIHGPTWFQDYGLYGMQYGARQVFGEFAREFLRTHPQEDLFISSLWANGTDVFSRFFLTPEEQQRVRMGSVDTFLLEQRELNPKTTFVFTREEYLEALNNPKLEVLEVLKTIPYPNATPGFYVLKMDYSEQADAIFTKEAVTRREPVTGEAQVMGQNATVVYSPIEAGKIADIFDGDRFTLVRGYEANPFVVEIRFPKAVQVSGLAADLGSMDFTLSIFIYAEGAQEPLVFSRTYRNLENDPHVELELDGQRFATAQVRIEILSLSAGETAKIHVRELKLLP